MYEQSKKLWSWLQRGAHSYICGDASQMANDVPQTLLGIATEHREVDWQGAKRCVADIASSR